MSPLSRRLSYLLSLALLTGGCGGDGLTLPGDSTPTRVVVITGNAQAGIAGSTLPLPLVVKVTDQLDRAAANQGVDFTVQSGGGQLSSAHVMTDTAGRASATWTLGPGAGSQQVRATVVGALALTQSFSAVAVAGSGSLIAAVRGDDQSAAVNSALGDSLVIRASDGNGNPVAGVSIEWTVQGGGSIDPATVVTGQDGRAGAARILGPSAGQRSARAAAAGLAGSPVTFVQTALPSNPTVLAEVSGNGQSAAVGTEVASDLVVQLTDASGNGVGGRPVSWVISTGGGSVTPVNSTTDPSGFARTRWTVGTNAGTNTLNAVFSGLPAVPFSSTATAGPPASLAVAVQPSATAQAGIAISVQPQARLRDTGGNNSATAGVTVTAAIASGPGGATLSNATAITNAAGIATFAGLSINGQIGSYTLGFSSGALTPVTSNTITVSAGAAANLAFTAAPGSGQANVTLAPVVVAVTDAFGNTADATVHINLDQVFGSTGVLSGTADQLSLNGSATFDDLVIDASGLYTVTASAPGASPVTSALFFVSP